MYILLIIEDDPDIRNGIKVLLEKENFRVLEAANGMQGIKMARKGVDIIIMDIMMSGLSGYDTCKEIRKFTNVPILFLTARIQETDKLRGFQAGGDDYVVKPFSYAELLARLKALLRRRTIYDQDKNAERTDQYLERPPIRIDLMRNRVEVDGDEKDLTEIEYKMLLLFAKYPHKIFSVANLYESVWNMPFLPSLANTVMVHIRNLRAKIEKDPQRPTIIRTVWGKGYIFQSEEV